VAGSLSSCPVLSAAAKIDLSTPARQLEAGMSARTYLGFLPWIVFAVVGRGSLEGVAWGSVAALLTAAAIAAVSARDRSVKELEIFALALFVALSVAGALNQHDPRGFLQRYHNGLAVGALACFAVLSLAFEPFTGQYARELVQRKYWNTRRFNRANVELTLMWAVVFVAIAASQVTAEAIETRLGSTLFNWILPVGLIVAGVRQATMRWSDQFDGESMGLDAMLNQGELWDAR
jgi:hypothetical protein